MQLDLPDGLAMVGSGTHHCPPKAFFDACVAWGPWYTAGEALAAFRPQTNKSFGCGTPRVPEEFMTGPLMGLAYFFTHVRSQRKG